MALSDSDGNVFIHPDPFQDPQVLKISPKSSTTLLYKIPNDASSSLAFYDFNVTPSGTVWILANPFAKAELRAFKFDSGGSVKSSVTLEVPAGVQIKNFLALENDFLLVAGFYTDKAPASLHGHSFAGLFDDSGKVVRDLKDSLSPVDLATVNKGPYEGGSAAGEDGNAYLLDDNKIIVLSPGGEITQRIHFVKPLPELKVEGLYVSGGEAAVILGRVNKNHSVEKSFLVLDLSSGDTLGWYSLGEDVHYGVVGFSRNEGFTFYSNDHGFIKILKAPLN
ncbi:MAG: hypothetical protein WB421_00960 [Terriglobales bacterium]